MNFIKIFFLILILIFFSACGTIKNAKSLDSVEITPVRHDNFKKFHGMVKSERTSDLSFQSEGRINFLPYTKGDFVRKGQVLARLDGILYKIRKNEELARLKDAEVQYNKAKNYYKRMDTLHKEGAISDNDWDEAYFNFKSTAENIKIQKEKINYLNEEISYNIITAPYDGYILEKYTEVGSYAKIGERILTIIGTNKTQVEIMVDSDTINKINLEKTVTAERNGYKYCGKIKHISKSSIASGGYLVKIHLDELVPILKDGMSMEVTIPFCDYSLSSVPLNSVFEENDDKYVYKIVNIKNNTGELQKEKIETGAITEDMIEVTKGLKKDDYVVSGEIEKLSPHTKVKIKK